jgi:hypothetical protein
MQTRPMLFGLFCTPKVRPRTSSINGRASLASMPQTHLCFKGGKPKIITSKQQSFPRITDVDQCSPSTRRAAPTLPTCPPAHHPNAPTHTIPAFAVQAGRLMMIVYISALPAYLRSLLVLLGPNGLQIHSARSKAILLQAHCAVLLCHQISHQM